MIIMHYWSFLKSKRARDKHFIGFSENYKNTPKPHKTYKAIGAKSMTLDGNGSCTGTSKTLCILLS